MSGLQPGGDKIAMDIAKKTAEAAKIVASAAQQPEQASKIAADVAKKAGQFAIGKISQTAQEAGQEMGR